VAHQAGLALPARLDADRARELARLAGAPVVLRPWVRREGGVAALGVDALEAESGRVLFTVSERVGASGGIAAAVDGLSDRIRRGLDERAGDRRIRTPVAEAVTASPEAARAYYEGMACLARSRVDVACTLAFERALADDPTFPLAHYQLARASYLLGASGEEARPHAAAALAGVGRLPPRDAELVRALSDQLAGRAPEALRRYDTVLAADPDDVDALDEAADAYSRLREWGSAARYLEKLVQVAPDRDEALSSLIDALGRSGRLGALAAVRDRLAAEGDRRVEFYVDACAWLGDRPGAVVAARRAAQGGDPAAVDVLQYALRLNGDFAEAEAVGRRLMAIAPSLRRRLALSSAIGAQGRVNEALALGDEAFRESPVRERESSDYRRAMIAAVAGDPARVWRYAAAGTAVFPEVTADLALVLLLLGDAPHAEALAANLHPDGPGRAQVEALRRLHAGDATGAAAILAREE